MDQDERVELAKRVTRARLNAGWSKEEAARRAGISPITLRRIEDALPVQDLKAAAAMAMVREAERPASERLQEERERAAAERERSDQYARDVDARQARRRAAYTPEEADEETRYLERQRTAREQARLWQMGHSPWPDGVDPDNLDSLLQARSQLWDYLRTVRDLTDDAKRQVRHMSELHDLIQGQMDLIMHRLRQLDPELKSVKFTTRSGLADLWREEMYLARAARPPREPFPEVVDDHMPEDVIAAARAALQASRAARLAATEDSPPA